MMELRLARPDYVRTVTYELPVLLVGLLLYLAQETFYSSLPLFACHCVGMVGLESDPLTIRTRMMAVKRI